MSLGFTSVQDMSIGLPQSRSVEILGRLNPPLRWREICFPLTPEEACDSGPATAPLVTASGIKWIGDGTPIERLAFVTEPYADLPTATLHPDRPSEALTREQAVSAYTAGSAYAEGEEQQKGSLAPGRLADLAVLSQDLFTVPFFLIPGTESVLTMVDGRIVWDAGVVVAAP